MAVRRKPLSATVRKTLRAKAKSSGYALSTLTKVYRRGQGAWLSGSRPKIGMAQWAMARVNSFMRGSLLKKMSKLYKSGKRIPRSMFKARVKN